jgi:DNA modification methylase
MIKIEHIKINNSRYINENSLLVMQQMIDKGKKVNCIIVDPPYGINHKSNRRKDKSDLTTRKGIMNDVDNQDLLEQAINLSYQCLADNSHIYWFTRWDKLEEQMPMLRQFYNIKNVLVWDKGNHGSGDLTGAYGNRYECIIYAMKGRRELNKIDGKQRHDYILEFSKVSAQKLIHPHQKPIDLLEFLILKSTNEGETILDMFAGVGSTLCAAIKNNRNCLAMELDNEMYIKGIEYINKDFKDYIKIAS